MTTRKRPIDKGSHENSKKRIKVGGDEIRDEEMRDRYDSNSINKACIPSAVASIISVNYL